MIKHDQPTIFTTDDLIAGVSSRSDGNMKILPDDNGLAIHYRRVFMERLNLHFEDGVFLFVGDHTAWDVVHEVDEEERGAGMTGLNTAITGDALVTNEPGVALVLITGDCSPVIIHDPVKKALALVHLGWQSTAANLATKVIQRLADMYGSQPTDLRVYNGPAIHATSYAFEPPIVQTDLPEWAPYLIGLPDGKIGIDLIGYNRAQFIAAGVPEAHIQIAATDTGVSPDYFSHYRAARSGEMADDGRFATVCALK